MSYRRLWVLVRHLPPESWTQTALRDESFDEALDALVAPEAEQRHGPWALANYQLARLTDEVAWLRYTVARTSPGNDKYPEPQPTPRPGLRRREPGGLSEAAVLYLNKLRPTGG